MKCKCGKEGKYVKYIGEGWIYSCNKYFSCYKEIQLDLFKP